MKSLAILFALFLSSCATWKGPAEKTLGIAHNSVRNARLQSTIICKPVVIHCIEEKKNPCPALDSCFALRKKLVVLLQSTEMAVKLGYEALEASDAEGGKEVALSAVKIATANAADILALIKLIKESF